MTNNATGQFTEDRIAEHIWRYCSPILLVVGTIGNLLAMCVLLRKRMRSTTTMFYLAALAIVDLFVLYTGLLRYWIIEVYDTDFRLRSTVSCKVHTFLVYFSLETSVWILVAVTVDRAIFVCIPFRARRFCTIRNSRVVISVILVSTSLLNVHFLWMMGIYREGMAIVCDISHDVPPGQYNYATKIHIWLDFCFYSAIPFSVMIVCNILIIRQMALRRWRLAAHLNGASRRNASLSGNQPVTISSNWTIKRRRTHCSSVTVTLLTVNIVFLFTTLPVVVYLVGERDWLDGATEHGTAVLKLVWAIVNILQYSNNAMHFFMYCLAGPRFRREFMLLIRRKNKVSHGIEIEHSTTPEIYPTSAVHI